MRKQTKPRTIKQQLAMRRTELTGSPTELAWKLRARTDKPHIYIRNKKVACWGETRYVLDTQQGWPLAIKTKDWLLEVNPTLYHTIGEAARAWHNYKGN